MRIKQMLALLMFSTLALVLWNPAGLRAQELIANGSFETGDFTGWNVVNFGTSIWETRTGGQAGTHYGNAENPLAGGGTFVAYGNTGAAGRSALYQDVTIPADATSAFLSLDVGYQATGAGLSNLMVIDVLDLLGLPNDFNYAGGTIYTQYYYRTAANGSDPMAARAPLDLLGVAGINPGATVRVRCFIFQNDFSLGATLDRVSLVAYPYTSATPPPDDSPPPGGSDDLFGACGLFEWMPLGLSGQVTQIPGQGDLLLTRLLPIPALGPDQGQGSPGGTDPEVPGLIIRITDPQGRETEYFVALGGSGTLPNGVEYTTEIVECQGVRSLLLTLNWPAQVLAGLAPGLWTVTYQTLDSEGRYSNLRWEYLEKVQDQSSTAGKPVSRAGSELVFKLGLYQFSAEDNLLYPVDGGTCQAIRDGAVTDTFRIQEGGLTLEVPFGLTTRLYFNWPGIYENIRLRLEFQDGFLQVYDENRNDAAVEVFKILGTEYYAIEYYRNRIYICNQGQEGGPVEGRLYGPWPD